MLGLLAASACTATPGPAVANTSNAATLCSAWCRCTDTAHLAFGKHAVWAALNSTFGDRVQQPEQTTQVNISAIAGQGTAMGEALIVDRTGKLLARSTFA